MNITPETISALKRHLLGALSVPSKTCLEPVTAPELSFASAGVLQFEGEACLLDFGRVASPGVERRRIRICNRGERLLNVSIAESPSWLAVEWLASASNSRELLPEANGAELLVTIAHDAAQEMHRRGTIALLLEEAGGATRRQAIIVRFSARPLHAIGHYDFNGHSEPHGFDFGQLETASAHYELAFDNSNAVPLVVSFADLPEWLTFSVDGEHRSGPVAGRFFERAAPFRAAIAANAAAVCSGEQSATMQMRTNDARAAFQNVSLAFRARAGVPVEVAPPSRKTSALNTLLRPRLAATALLSAILTWLLLSMWSGLQG